MISRLKFVSALVLAVVCSRLNAQDIDPANFDNSQFVQAIVDGINQARWRAGMDSVLVKDELNKAASELSEFYKQQGKVTILPGEAGVEAKKAGATKKVEEAAVDVSIGKGKTFLTYQEAAADAIEKLVKQKKFEAVIKNPRHVYAGVGTTVLEDKKKLFISVVLGGVDAFNAGAKDRKKLKLKYTKSKRGLDPYNAKECKQCDKFTDLQDLYDGVKIEGDKVYIEHKDFKKFKKYFKNPGDGLAIEFVQKNQYPCDGPNIMDFNLNSKGYLFKPVYQAKLHGKNLNQVNDKKNNTYKGQLAKIKKKVSTKIDDNYEYNLYYICNKTVCKVMTRQYLEGGGEEGLDPLAFYPDSITSTDPSAYIPKPENQILTFRVPFEQGKSNYDVADIKPFLDKLREPAYVINEINITAHSSLEGDSAMNSRLQRDRAQSIISALEKIQNKKVIGKIETSDSWEMFQDSVKKKSEYKEWVGLSKADAKAKLQGGGATTMEPILKNERFALIEMKVTFDFTGANEEQFVANRLRQAIEKKDVEMAKRISRFMVQQIEKKRYTPTRYLELQVPNECAYANILVSQFYVHNKFNEESEFTEALRTKVNDLHAKCPDNEFASWNKIMLDIKMNDSLDVKSINMTQGKINALYNGRIPQRLNDALNLEYQFEVIEALDTLDANTPNPGLVASMDRIKKIFNIESANAENSLKLATIFQRHSDLTYAKKLLEPFLTDEKPNKELIFTYIAIAAHDPNEIFGRNFRLAMSKAKELDQDRYCKLFGSPYLTFQVMDNPAVKKTYCETCGTGTSMR